EETRKSHSAWKKAHGDRTALATGDSTEATRRAQAAWIGDGTAPATPGLLSNGPGQSQGGVTPLSVAAAWSTLQQAGFVGNL
ncbi:unnamed protein product, partial [Ectocarpus fasciculatus]